MVEPIAAPYGLFKAGSSGAGGDYEPLEWIRRDILQMNHVIFGLVFNENYVPKSDSVIIDLVFDGDQKFIVHDPQLKVSQLVTNQPSEPGVWFCPADLPRYVKFSAPGKHKLTVKVAPRTPPAAGTESANQTLPPRDFSPEAGGIVDTYEWEIKPSDYPLPVAPSY